jgi:hypothetical protein
VFHPGYTEVPDPGFFDAFLSRFDAWHAAEGETSRGVDKVLGATHAEMQNRREVGETDRERYAEILDEAYSGAGMDNPVAFLKGLSQADLEIVRRTHSLADAINPDVLTREGAYNLLLPEGYKVDFNGDGMSEVGIARICIFPPLDAPRSFKNAWLAATRDMREADYLTYELVLWGALHPMDGRTMQTVQGLPSDEESSYGRILRDLLEANECFRAFLAPGQYERDKAFYTRLLALLAA